MFIFSLICTVKKLILYKYTKLQLQLQLQLQFYTSFINSSGSKSQSISTGIPDGASF